jgi:hypothetical protein
VRAVGVADGVVLGEPEPEDAVFAEHRGEMRIALPLVSGNSTAGA